LLASSRSWQTVKKKALISEGFLSKRQEEGNRSREE
jgi:hypothetical protein